MNLFKTGHSDGAPESEKAHLWRIFILSAVIDIITTTGVLATYGLGVIVEEIIENLLSQVIANYGNIQLSKLDNIAGTIPIPGVTAVTVHCARKLVAMYQFNRH